MTSLFDTLEAQPDQLAEFRAFTGREQDFLICTHRAWSLGMAQARGDLFGLHPDHVAALESWLLEVLAASTTTMTAAWAH
jgi:hypothetical protein